jgi:Fe-Mn family superoxide dismutase
MAFELPALPFPRAALEPHVSARTMEFHHGKHHAAYVETLNELIQGTEFERLRLEEIIQASAESAAHRKIFNNAGQHCTHRLFWHCLRPWGGGRPDGALAEMIERDLGGFDAFREKFIQAGTDRFGSGWAWLVVEAGKLAVIATPNGEPPMVSGRHALLTCDVWEHAYYLDYQNRRQDFLAAFLDHLVNWEFAAERLGLEGEGSYTGAHRYRQGVERFAGSGKVGEAAAAARQAIEGPEGDALRRAEDEGRKRSRGEDRRRSAAAAGGGVEGEGSYSAARQYDAGAERHARSGKSGAAAQAAKSALEGPEGSELRRAEEAGKRRSKGEDPKSGVRSQEPGARKPRS